MSTFTCPQCKRNVELVPETESCPACGWSFQSPLGTTDFVRAGRNLRDVARFQRRVLWLILAQIGVMALWFYPNVVAAGGSDLIELFDFAVTAIQLGLSLILIVTMYQLLRALGTHIVIRIILMPLLLISCVGLLILLRINHHATKALRQAGLRVGFMGVSDEAVVQHMGRHLCRTCGYNLFGTVSGRCPECGEPAPVRSSIPIPERI